LEKHETANFVGSKKQERKYNFEHSVGYPGKSVASVWLRGGGVVQAKLLLFQRQFSKSTQDQQNSRKSLNSYDYELYKCQWGNPFVGLTTDGNTTGILFKEGVTGKENGKEYKHKT